MEAKIKTIRYSLIFNAFFLIIFFSATVQAATHYVSTNGSAAWASSTNINTPSSLSTANSNAVSDDVIVLLSGNYSSQQLAPSHSGTSGHPITFQKNTGATCTFSKTGAASVELNGVSYIVIDGLTFGANATVRHVNLVNGAKYNEVKNSTFTGTLSYPDLSIDNNSNYNYVHDNVFNPGGEATNESNEADTIGIHGSSYNRIINNQFNEGHGHFFIMVSGSDHNIVRNNTGRVTTYWNSAKSPDNASLDGWVEVENLSYLNLIEDNTWERDEASVSRGLTLVERSSKNIFRKNIYINSRGYFSIYCEITGANAIQNVFYNNTLYITGDFYDRNPGVVNLSVGNSNGDVTYNEFVNNILLTAPYQGFKIANYPSTVHNNKFRGNILYNITGNQVNRYDIGMNIAEAQSSYPSEFSSNLTSNPELNVMSDGDITLRSESPAIDEGVWLTTFTSLTGSGRIFVARNPYFFYDGWGIPGESGDVIKTQNKQSATITSINYSTGQITINKSIDWTKGEGIALYYQGNGPDIGANEYPSDSTSIAPPEGLTIMVN